jgi:hypothetical protein
MAKKEAARPPDKKAAVPTKVDINKDEREQYYYIYILGTHQWRGYLSI